MTSTSTQPPIETLHFCEAGRVYQHLFADRVKDLADANRCNDDDDEQESFDKDIDVYVKSACVASYSHGNRKPAFLRTNGLIFGIDYNLCTGSATHLKVMKESVSSYEVYTKIEFGRLKRKLQKRGAEDADPNKKKKARVVFVECGHGVRQPVVTTGSDA